MSICGVWEDEGGRERERGKRIALPQPPTSLSTQLGHGRGGGDMMWCLAKDYVEPQNHTPRLPGSGQLL